MIACARMRRARVVAAALGLLWTAGGCARPLARRAGAAPIPATAPLLAAIGVEPKAIDLGLGQQARFRYTLGEAATVRIDVVDDGGRILRRLEPGARAAGSHAEAWDGLDSAGQRVPDGAYRYVLRATDLRGHEAAHDPSAETGGEELTPRNFSFEREPGRLAWMMPKAGYARLRVGVEGFPHLRTLLDWQPLEAGPQSLAWDGLDASGLIKAKAHPNLSIKLHAFALPDNTLIVRGSGRPPAPGRGGDAAYPPAAKGPGAYLHASHSRAVCHEVGLSIDFPDSRATDAEGRPLLAGRVAVRVTIDPEDAGHLLDQRFETVIFEGLTVLFEDEESSNPFTFLWDTSRLRPGPQLLTVNMLSYDDHYGLATRAVVVQAAPAGEGP